MEDGKRRVRWENKGTEPCIGAYIHAAIAATSPSLPLFAPCLHLSNFKALWRENMSVTGGVILGGQCLTLKHAQQTRGAEASRE